eukprot:Amastigsp_a174469_227.p2 type:complete len:153 gc:universal Amastigsp_a174469_227:1041-583(-)
MSMCVEHGSRLTISRVFGHQNALHAQHRCFGNSPVSESVDSTENECGRLLPTRNLPPRELSALNRTKAIQPQSAAMASSKPMTTLRMLSRAKGDSGRNPNQNQKKTAERSSGVIMVSINAPLMSAREVVLKTALLRRRNTGTRARQKRWRAT